MANGLSRIEHIVVLMEENRSFDNLLGWQSGELDPATMWNLTDRGERIPVWRDEGTGYATMTMPDPDPGELFTDMNYQLFESYFVPDVDPPPPTMGGFVRDYVNQAIPDRNRQTPYDPRAIMHCFTPEQLPVTSLLARSFGVAHRWFASAPCQTFPNRCFVHAATADGWVNNLPDPPWDVVERFPYDMPTIFNQLTAHFSLHDLWPFDKGWRIYFHDFPNSLLLSQLWGHLDHFHGYRRFHDDVASGNLQPYSFIEPRYYPNLEQTLLPNDDHPPHDVTLGEQLIADVYNTLRGSRYWTKTLFILLCDEHGGCYDHVAPGPAQAPDDGRAPKPGQYGFTFDRYGVRVPALLISPYVAPGPVEPPPGGPPFDHTTVIKTARERFAPGKPALTRRDEVAPSLASVLGSEPANLGPEHIPIPPYTPPVEAVQAAAAAPLTDFQRLMLYAADALPARDRVLEHLEAVRHGVKPAATPLPHRTPAEALPHIKAKLAAFLGREEGE
jgi:phospholipase C